MTVWLFRRFLFSKRSGALIRTISWLCVAGIGLGVFALILVMSVMNGFNKAIQDRLLAVEPHLVVEFKDRDEEKKWRKWQSNFLSENLDIRSSEYETQDVVAKTVDGYFSGAQARGVNEETLIEIVSRLRTEKNEPVQFQLAENQVLLGMGLAQHLQVYEGDELTLVKPEDLLLPPGQVPQFTRVVAQGFLSTFVGEVDQTTFFYLKDHALRRFQDAASLKRGVELFLPDPMSFQHYKKQIVAAGFAVESWKDRNSALFRALRMEKTMIGLFLGLSTMIASFSIVTVLILLSAQKKREFGLMLSMGMTAERLQRTFSKLGLMLSGSGIVFGLIFGTALSYYIQFNPLNILPNIYYDSRIPALVDLRFIAAVAVGALVTALLASWLPAKGLAGMWPAQALRGRGRVE